jgi:hypothetical protein
MQASSKDNLVEFDLRDPGEFWLQLGIDWYFGDTEPGHVPLPQCVSGFQGLHWDYRKSDEYRAMVHWGRELKVTTSNDSLNTHLSTVLPEFSDKKCRDGVAPGRWLNMNDKPCNPPYCTGDRFATVNHIDWVRLALVRTLSSLCIAVNRSS